MRSAVAVAPDRMTTLTGVVPAAVVAVMGDSEPRAGEPT
jgi:hypothetical protein